MNANQRFARIAATLAVRSPFAWRLLRAPLRSMFDRIAPDWETRIGERYFAPLEAALDALPQPPRRILDVGTGTGAAARLSAARWPDAEITGIDLSPGMIEQAAHRGGPNERYVAGDASRLPFPDGSFDLVTLVNMIPFTAELARVTAPGGSVAVAYTWGTGTPIFVPLERVEAELGRLGFAERRPFAVGDGLALLATKS